jgi:hypothetical protein
MTHYCDCDHTPDTLYYDDRGLLKGCDNCIIIHRVDKPCPMCEEDAIYHYIKRGKVVGCDRCITEEDVARPRDEELEWAKEMTAWAHEVNRRAI